jgi:hypothetical protein
MSRVFTFQPSILVGAGISRRGGVHYIRHELDVTVRGDSETKRWETTREVVNTAEMERAEQAVGEYRRMLAKVCIRTEFGLLCLKAKEAVLDATIEEIRSKAANVNDGLNACRIHVAFVKGQIASADKEAAAAIQAEIRHFMDQLSAALHSMDPKAIRSALLTGKGLDTLLTVTDSTILQNAVKAAKRALKTASRRIQKKGEQVELVRQAIDLSPVDQARTYFLEIPEEG